MNEFKSLADRLKAATDQIAALAGKSNSVPEISAEVETIVRENARLEAENKMLREARERDMAELDELMEKLSPLIGGADA